MKKKFYLYIYLIKKKVINKIIYININIYKKNKTKIN